MGEGCKIKIQLRLTKKANKDSSKFGIVDSVGVLSGFELD
jgi:hypothetical protein